MKSIDIALTSILFSTVLSGVAVAKPQLPEQASDRAKEVIEYWTPDRIAAAQPRDLVIDSEGNGFIKRADGRLQAYGADHKTMTPMARPKGNSDTTPPTISNMSPSEGSTIGSAATFSATVSDESGVKSVTMTVFFPSGGQQSFSMSKGSGDTWSVDLQGFSNGNWSWEIQATDNSGGRGNSNDSRDTTSNFVVDTSTGGNTGGGTNSDIITNERYTTEGGVKNAAGRIYFEMPADRRLRSWNGYVCSGTVATDDTSGRSIIITAAHCVYDDAYKKFARNVLFIPNQDGTSGGGTDLNCANDPMGCWAPQFGVVDKNWTTRTFPDNIPWDYAYYVVSDSGSHSGNDTDLVLDSAAGSLMVSFVIPVTDDGTPGKGSPDFTHALGYSYSDDPYFMFCAEDMTTEGAANWWLDSCGLSGGASGGPWVQPLIDGTGDIISVNSWGYTTRPGMAGPKLSGTSAACVFDVAVTTQLNMVSSRDGEAGVVVDATLDCQ